MSVSRNTAYNLVGAGIPLILSFVTIPAYLHLIGADRYGVLAIAWLLLGYFGLFDLGLGKATSFRIASGKDANAAAMLINAGIGIIGGLILWAAAAWYFTTTFKTSEALRAEMIAALPWLAASVPVATMTGVLTGALQGREQFLKTNTVSVTSTILFQLFPLGVAWFIGPRLPWLLAAAVSARIAAILVLWFFCHGEFNRGQHPRWRPDEARRLLGFGGWVTLNGLMWPLLIMADRFIIGAVLGARAVAVYTIPFQLAQRSGIVPTALSNALFPRMSALSPEARHAILDKAIRSLVAILTMPVYIGFFLIHPFLNVWVGPGIGDAAYRIGIIVIFGFWANAFMPIYFTFYQAQGRPHIVSRIVAIQALPYLPLLWLVMREWGLVGAAALFAVRALVSSIALLMLNRPSPYTMRLVLIAITGLVTGLALSHGAANGSTPSIAAALGVLAILGAATLSIGLSDYPHLFKRLMPSAR
jgi:O-antigen/teichoic acid export membrane protein